MTTLVTQTALVEKRENLEAKRQELADIFESAKTDDGLKMTADQVDAVRALNEELADLVDDYEQAKELDGIYQKNRQKLIESRKAAKNLPFRSQPTSNGDGAESPQSAAIKSLADMFLSSPQYEKHRQGETIEVAFKDFDPQYFGLKTTMTTSAGFAPENLRTGRVVESAQRRPMVDEIIPQTTTDQAAVVYMEETTFTNNAAETAEEGSYPEGALAFTERSDTIRKIATFLPVTDEQLDDVPQMRSLLGNRLALMIRLRREAQLLAGDGSSPNLTGFLNKSGVQTQAKGADPVPDAIYKGITLVRHTGFADPTAVIFHPNDWQDVRLLRTTDGIYIWGNPSEAGPERIWGLPVIATTAQTENTALAGDFQLYSEIFFKQGIMIKVSDSHSDYFVKGKQAIRADERLALVIYRAAAFCKITGI